MFKIYKSLKNNTFILRFIDNLIQHIVLKFINHKKSHKLILQFMDNVIQNIMLKCIIMLIQ